MGVEPDEDQIPAGLPALSRFAGEEHPCSPVADIRALAHLQSRVDYPFLDVADRMRFSGAGARRQTQGVEGERNCGFLWIAGPCVDH
ncbi:MAG TPA: hypothetical protein EYQ61_11750 [Dehalococcoidia bacterium]|nr:hypothetical protein [Dehalococcoidia bacterium]HIK89201.1 hypothetical protein [Dehalococcoidia bacterium]